MRPKEAEEASLPPARRLVKEAIDKRPGLSVSDVARKLDLFWTSAALHVASLERAGLIRCVRVGRRRVLFPAALLASEDVEAAALLAEPACTAVAVAIVAHPDLRVWELADVTGISERAIYHHVKRLVQAELVSTERSRGYRGLRPTPRLLQWLASHEL